MRNKYYKVLTADTLRNLTTAVNQHLETGWEIVGSHQVTIAHTTHRYRGDQLTDSTNELEYSQTIVKHNDDVEKIGGYTEV